MIIKSSRFKIFIIAELISVRAKGTRITISCNGLDGNLIITADKEYIDSIYLAIEYMFTLNKDSNKTLIDLDSIIKNKICSSVEDEAVLFNNINIEVL